MEIDFKFNVCNKRRFMARRVIGRAPALLLIPVRGHYQKRLPSCRESHINLIAEYRTSPKRQSAICVYFRRYNVSLLNSARSAILRLYNSLRNSNNTEIFEIVVVTFRHCFDIFFIFLTTPYLFEKKTF